MTTHTHTFTRSKPQATVETCACGKFRHTEHAGPPIVAMTTHTPAYTTVDVRGTVKLVSRTGNPLIELKPASAEGGADYDSLVRLIAAAPEMLAGLKASAAALAVISTGVDDAAALKAFAREEFTKARALLARVGG